MLGNPKYKVYDKVSFKIEDENNIEYTLTGEVYIVDAYGTFEQDEEPSYDIMVESGDYPTRYPSLFKYIRESEVFNEQRFFNDSIYYSMCISAVYF